MLIYKQTTFNNGMHNILNLFWKLASLSSFAELSYLYTSSNFSPFLATHLRNLKTFFPHNNSVHIYSSITLLYVINILRPPNVFKFQFFCFLWPILYKPILDTLSSYILVVQKHLTLSPLVVVILVNGSFPGIVSLR